jgi:hypothetical protein
MDLGTTRIDADGMIHDLYPRNFLQVSQIQDWQIWFSPNQSNRICQRLFDNTGKPLREGADMSRRVFWTTIIP